MFLEVGILEKRAEGKINDQNDPFKDLTAEKLQETTSELCERLPNEAPEGLNAAVLLDIDTELSKNGDKPSNAEILAEMRGKVVQEEQT